MKRFFAVSLLVSVAVVSSQAEMTRLGSFRVKSLADVGAAASALSIMAEQPMMGMMAMGALQQGAQQQFGLVDQSKPISCVMYSKAPLPDFSAIDLENNPGEMMAFATNVVYAALIPVTQSAEEYLQGRGATNVVDGVAKVDEKTYIVCKDGYAIYSNDPAAAKLAGRESPRLLMAALDSMVVEIVLEKSALEKYAEFLVTAQKLNEAKAEFSPFGEFAGAITEYQKAQMEMLRQLMGEMDKLAFGLNYDLTGGLTMDFAMDLAKTGEFGKMIANAGVIQDDVYARIPANSDFYMVSASISALSFQSKKTLQSVLTTLVPVIKDEELRKKVEVAIAEVNWLYDNLGEVVAFCDRDKQGRMVMVSRAKSTDNARYLAANKTMIACLMDVLKKYAPEQKFFTYDPSTQSGLIAFEGILKMISEKVGEEPEVEEVEKMMKAFDVVLGRTFEFSSQEKNGYVYDIGKASGSDYSMPAASGSSAIADRVKAVMPKGSIAKPFQVVSFSMGSSLKHFVPRVMKAVGEEDEALAGIFANLADASAGGIMVVVWNENGKLRETLNVSAAELKGFFKLFLGMQQHEKAQFDGAMEELDEGGMDAVEEDGDDMPEAPTTNDFIVVEEPVPAK